MLVYSDGPKDVIETCPDLLFEGGEGKVYALATEPGRLAKIFDDPAAHQRHEKLKLLRASSPYDPPSGADGHRRFAWPQDLLFDPNDRSLFKGYTMPRIPGGETLNKFIVRNTPLFRPEMSFRLGLAIAVAKLFAELHRHRLMIVVGDISLRNFLADAQGRVAVIDLDSVQITSPHGRTYLCPAGTPFYEPPELYGKDFAHEQRTKEHDRFGLAVIIFQSLFDGVHPFDSQNPRALADRIRDGEWPYTPGAPYAPPPDAPLFSALPAELQRLFVLAFLIGHHSPKTRPSAEDWVDALTRYENALRVGVPTTVPTTPTPPAAAPRRTRSGVLAFAAAALVVVTVGVLGGWLVATSPETEGRVATVPTAEVKPAPPQPQVQPQTQTQPRSRRLRQGPWEQVREQEAQWEHEMHTLLDIVKELPPEVLRDPDAAVSACIEQDMQGDSTYLEYLVHHGEETFAALDRVQRTTRALCQLLEQLQSAHRQSPDSLPSAAEGDIREAFAAIRRGEERVETAAILSRLLRDELVLIADLPQRLGKVNACLQQFCKRRPDSADVNPRRDCAWAFDEAIRRAVVLREVIQATLRTSRARLAEPPLVPLRR